MERRDILVSACLLGEACRYDGASQPCGKVVSLEETCNLVPVCPEQLGGLPTPRTPSEVQADGHVIDHAGNDRTQAFANGAQAAVDIALRRKCSSAILKSRSPSCGVNEVYDGTFTGTIVPGRGIAAAALHEAGISIADETDFEERLGIKAPSKQVRRIVITGGPCAGKTSAMNLLRERFAQCGTRAVFVSEAATDLIIAGISPWSCASMLDFQTQVIALQIEREASALVEAANLGPDAAMICDRGICDSHAYLSDDDYEKAIASNGLSNLEALARYDAVFHLESIAKADLGAYTRANNSARFETAEEAVQADERVLAAWSAHPNVKVIANEASFQQKADNLMKAIEAFLSGQ